MKNDTRRRGLDLLQRKRERAMYRTNQAQYGGDFGDKNMFEIVFND